ncbi:type I restriction enzyme S subunit [Salegentibacter sp. 24]|uniref:restriction endonuclease subunit S n=1 Tax=Salegentibacter sp. 24 TaxID=2183986 RepID=UPI00105C110A|nr:restriction endonuclease subunit S [Salegentibacter sp. 24]TDN87097.1 type I restriction enzyme S subunit [Salegentibacter sp. 24]
MELMEKDKTGFKNTAIGLIPKDWSVLNLGSSSTLKARIGWQGLTTAEYLNSGDYFLVTGTDFENGFIDWNNCVYVEKERYDQDKYIQLRKGDVLVTKDGTIGKVAYIDRVPKLTTLNSGVFVIRPKGDAYDPNYFYYVLRSSVFHSFLSKLSAGSTINHLYQKDFIFFDFPAPPTLEEQKAIATALSDTDTLIAGLEKLITKKKAIKQGVMHQLLTPPSKGGKRLPGFSGEWEERPISSIVKKDGLIRGPFGGALKKECFVNNGYKVYEQKNAIYKSITLGDYYVDDNKYKELRRFKVEANDFILSCSGTIGKMFKIPSDFPEGIINQALLIIRLDANYNNLDFFFHQFTSPKIQNKVIDDTQGGAMKNLVGMDEFKKAELPYPPTKEEQEAIATILYDMDKEIEALDSKKAKYEQVKQGMVQELLTGKTRLV